MEEFTLRIKPVISKDFNDLTVPSFADTSFHITLLVYILHVLDATPKSSLIPGMLEVQPLFAFILLILFEVAANYFRLTWNSEKISGKLLVANITHITNTF